MGLVLEGRGSGPEATLVNAYSGIELEGTGAQEVACMVGPGANGERRTAPASLMDRSSAGGWSDRFRFE